MFRPSALHDMQHKKLAGNSRAKVSQSQEVSATAYKYLSDSELGYSADEIISRKLHSNVEDTGLK